MPRKPITDLPELTPQEANNINRLFSHSRSRSNSQVTNVNINIDTRDDCLTGCFKTIFKALRRG